VAEDQDLVGPNLHPPAWLPFRLAALPAGLELAERLQVPVSTSKGSPAIIVRWLVNDNLLPSVSTATVTGLILSDH